MARQLKEDEIEEIGDKFDEICFPELSNTEFSAHGGTIDKLFDDKKSVYESIVKRSVEMTGLGSDTVRKKLQNLKSYVTHLKKLPHEKRMEEGYIRISEYLLDVKDSIGMRARNYEYHHSPFHAEVKATRGQLHTFLSGDRAPTGHNVFTCWRGEYWGAKATYKWHGLEWDLDIQGVYICHCATELGAQSMVDAWIANRTLAVRGEFFDMEGTKSDAKRLYNLKTDGDYLIFLDIPVVIGANEVRRPSAVVNFVVAALRYVFDSPGALSFLFPSGVAWVVTRTDFNRYLIAITAAKKYSVTEQAALRILSYFYEAVLDKNCAVMLRVKKDESWEYFLPQRLVHHGYGDLDERVLDTIIGNITEIIDRKEVQVIAVPGKQTANILADIKVRNNDGMITCLRAHI